MLIVLIEILMTMIELLTKWQDKTSVFWNNVRESHVIIMKKGWVHCVYFSGIVPENKEEDHSVLVQEDDMVKHLGSSRILSGIEKKFLKEKKMVLC